LNSTRRVLFGDGEWRESSAKGFWTKPLHEDRERGEKTILMKVDPGSYMKSHSHPDEFEQCFVLEGSFYDEHGTLKAGDYCFREPNEPHEAGSVDGAIILLVYTDRTKTVQG
jgi:quercetin dioxygenase-like cupin family protein